MNQLQVPLPGWWQHPTYITSPVLNISNHPLIEFPRRLCCQSKVDGFVASFGSLGGKVKFEATRSKIKTADLWIEDPDDQSDLLIESQS